MPPSAGGGVLHGGDGLALPEQFGPRKPKRRVCPASCPGHTWGPLATESLPRGPRRHLVPRKGEGGIFLGVNGFFLELLDVGMTPA